jgi:prepilin-type processing-associated H-X9-DG protein
MQSNPTLTKKDLVAVLGIAIFLLANLGAIRSGRRRAKDAVCLSNLCQWGDFFQMYTNDNNGYFNEGWGYGQHHPGKSGVLGLWMNALRPYYRDKWSLLLCPMATRTVENQHDGDTFRAWYRDVTNRYPSGNEGTTKRFVGSYSINSWTNYMRADRGARWEEWFWKNVYDTTSVIPGTRAPTRKRVSANTVPVFADSTWHCAWPRETDEPPPYPDITSSRWGTTNAMRHFCINRHNGFVNCLFMDWSVRNVGLKELWTLKWHRAYETHGPWTMAGGVTPGDWPEWMRKFKDY